MAWEPFVVAPVPDAALTWARGTLDGPQGTSRSSGAIEGERMSLTAEIPSGTSARVVMPDGTEHRIAAGRFEVSAMLPAAADVPATA